MTKQSITKTRAQRLRELAGFIATDRRHKANAIQNHNRVEAQRLERLIAVRQDRLADLSQR